MAEQTINIIETQEVPVYIDDGGVEIDVVSKVVVQTETIRPPNVVTSSGRNITVAVHENTDYKYGTLDTLTITDVDDSGLASSIQFTSGSTPTVFTYPSSLIEWVNEEINIEADSRYMIAFCNRIAYISKIKNI